VRPDRLGGEEEAVGIVLVILLVLLLAGALPRAGWPGEPYGYWPSGAVVLVLVVVLILLLLGHLPSRYPF
jgi:membrane protein YdbS with pleckstrin-like domain